MAEHLAVAVMHYHLRPGGVTRVIERAVESLGDEVEILCLSGEAPDPEDALAPLCATFPALAYDERPEADNIDALIDELRAIARDHFGRAPDIWHIHNHSLGKNSFTPRLVWRLANEGCRLLLQPHDFAEDGRAANYRLLKETLGDQLDGTLYPTADHVWYAPINFRDKSFLESIGVAEVHELPNAVTAHPANQSYAQKKTVVYPARAIRRKNLGEFLLWSLLAPEGWLFQSTLAPQNPKWRAYYDEWVAFAKELNLPVEFDAGRSHDFTELVQSAAALMTTSVQEGFGLAFLEPWLEGKALIGRKLPEITTDFEREGLDLSALYDTLPVPIEWAGEAAFLETLEQTLTETYAAYSKVFTTDLFKAAKTALIVDGQVDFGVLDETLQRNVIRHLAAHPEDQAILPPFMPSIPAPLLKTNRSVAEERYSPVAYGDRLLKVYRGLAATEPSSVHSADAPALLDQFLKPERFSLLRV